MVVVARAKRGSELVSGFAGCPVCHLEARFEGGDLQFPGEALPAAESTPDGWTPDLERTIALLGLDEPGGALLLSGRYASLAPQLVERLDVAVMLMGGGRRPGDIEAVAIVTGRTPNVPFTDGTFRSAAVDLSFPDALLPDLVRTIATKGRVLAVALHRPPPGLTELARDDREWVAARDASGALVELRRST